MSYSSFVLDLDPYFYFPMSVFDNNVPVDFQEQEVGSVVGDYGIEETEKFFSNQITLFPGGYFLLPSNSELTDSEFTYSFWLSSQVFDNPEIFSIHDSSQGLGISYDNSSEELLLEVYSEAIYSLPLKISSAVLITLVFSSGDALIYVDDSLFFTLPSVSVPTDPEVTLGTLKNLEADGEVSVSDFFYTKQALSALEITNLYILGFKGYENLSISKESALTILESDKTFFQTAWQSYGEITTKR